MKLQGPIQPVGGSIAEVGRLDVDGKVANALIAAQEAATQGGRFGSAAERVAHVLGTPKFLLAQTAICAAWMGYNSLPDEIQGVKIRKFDKYPFMALTLALSLQAAYAAPFILLASRRQEARDKAAAAAETAHREVLTLEEFRKLAAQDARAESVGGEILDVLRKQNGVIDDLMRSNAELTQRLGTLTEHVGGIEQAVAKVARRHI